MDKWAIAILDSMSWEILVKLERAWMCGCVGGTEDQPSWKQLADMPYYIVAWNMGVEYLNFPSTKAIDKHQ